MKQLESEAAAPAALPEPVVADLQRQIDALILERDSLREMHKAMLGVWCGDGPPNLEATRPCPLRISKTSKCGSAIGTAG